ncbi:MAG TPA: hypothetical protein EYG38_08875 [Verrucomicrobia bacterium]|nr:hypothetical protein [Verrucomicrobiota bacterium]
MDRTRGKFRSFLLTSLKNFLVNEWKQSQAKKRGGGKIHFSLDAADVVSQPLQQRFHESECFGTIKPCRLVMMLKI